MTLALLGVAKQIRLAPLLQCSGALFVDGDVLPDLIPTACDVGAPDCGETILVDLSECIHPLIVGKGLGARVDNDWEPVWRHSLISAMVGGQWTQARKAAVEARGIEDNQCQLCKAEGYHCAPRSMLRH